jgi:hypothetical protein
MSITIVHATCCLCRELLGPTDVLPHGGDFAHFACIAKAGEAPPPPAGAPPESAPPPPATDEPLLSPSTAHLIISKSPLQAWWKKFGGAPKEYTDPTDRGHLIHALLLGGDEIVGVDAEDWRTNKAKAERESARAAGKIPVLMAKLADAKEYADDIRRRLLAKGYDLTKGERELALNWSEGDTPCRGRLDWFSYEQAVILDLKIVADASKEACVRHMLKYGAAIQEAAYISAIEKRHPELAGRVRMKFAFFEAEPPSDYCIRSSSGGMRSVGQAQWKRAVSIWSACLERFGGNPENPWPGYDEDESEMDAPPWALEQELMNMENPIAPF